MWQITKMLVDERRSDLVRAAEREPARALGAVDARPPCEARGGGGPGHGVPPAVGHARGALREPARHRSRQHHPERGPARRCPARPAARPTSQLQWIVDAYTLVFAGLLLTAGSLGDRFGRKRALAPDWSCSRLGPSGSALVVSPGS